MPAAASPAATYLAKRGVGDRDRERFQLGYAPAEWAALADHLKAKHVDMELAVRLGLDRARSRAAAGTTIATAIGSCAR